MQPPVNQRRIPLKPNSEENKRRWTIKKLYNQRKRMKEPPIDPLTALINSLYGNGEQGAFYIPKPQVLGQQVLFQDSAGTTPVTADGDPVGLMLDVSQKMELGPELITNGTFDTDLSGWINSNNYWQWDNGTARHPFGSDFNMLLNSIPAEYAGKYVELSFSVSGYSGASGLRIQFRDSAQEPLTPSPYGSGGTRETIRSNGSYKAIAFVPENAEYVAFARDTSGATMTCSIDNISVRELKGNHATQATSAARPIYRTDGTLQQYDAVDDEMTVSIAGVTDATVIRATATGVVVDYPVDLSSGTYTINESHSGVIIREGALTAAQEQSAVEYLGNMQGVG